MPAVKNLTAGSAEEVEALHLKPVHISWAGWGRGGGGMWRELWPGNHDFCPAYNSEELLGTATHGSLILSPTIGSMNELDRVISKILSSLKIL